MSDNLARDFKIFAITGNIASGKSTIGEIFKKDGFIVIDSDDLSREATVVGSNALRQISCHFGSQVINHDGSLNRKKLAGIVFNSKSKLKELEDILHPSIRQLFLKKIQLNINNITVFYLVPLLFEKGLQNDLILGKPFDKIIHISCNKEKSIERILSRDNSSAHEAEVRLNNQLSNEEKIKLADIIIDNNSSKENLNIEIDKLLQELKL